MKSEIDVTPTPRLLAVLGDIPLHPWQCLAELIDNSLDEISRGPDVFTSAPLRVTVSIETDQRGVKSLVVSDNGLGMSVDNLETALKAGSTTKARYGTLGLFGMGFNIATARLGSTTTVTTARKEDPVAIQAVIDFASLQRRESFKVPISRVAKSPDRPHGTTVCIALKRELADFFSSPKNLQTVRNQLGDVYSYMLRSAVPGLSGRSAGQKIPADILVQGETVQPKYPCIWSDKRTVACFGQTVEAVQYLDQTLTEATACLSCGYWDKTNGPTECEECGSNALELRVRRVWGWIGIQRYIDSAHFGIDVLRFGRKILKQDKSIFAYQDPDTLQIDIEYPIEMPANQGRIVGEIHLDHVPVTYQKNDFDRQHRDWQKAVELIRGSGPLKQRSATVLNTSKLATLFSAFRRNDPGLRYLTAGDGRTAIHGKTKEWATYFDKGVPSFQDDTEWYEAAVRHGQAKVDQAQSAGAGEVATSSTGVSNSVSTDVVLPVGAVARLLGPRHPERATQETAEKQQPPKSREELLTQARAVGKLRRDLSGEFLLKYGIGAWKLTVVEASIDLVTANGQSSAVIPGAVKGNDIEVFVNPNHSVFREFGQHVREMCIMQAAEVIREMSNKGVATPVIYAEIICQIEDIRMTPPAIIERLNRALSRIRELMFVPVSAAPQPSWEALSTLDKQNIEEMAAVSRANVPFAEIVDSGDFVHHASGSALARLVRSAPLEFFEGKVFKPALRCRNAAGRDRIVGKVTRCMDGISEFLEDQMMRQPDDISLALINLETLESQVRSDEYGDS